MLIKDINQEEVIFRALGFFPVMKKKIVNPFRSDRTPGAYFMYKRGKIRLRDHASPEFDGWDCWDIYQRIFALPSVSDALKHYHNGGCAPAETLPRFERDVEEFRLTYAPIEWDQEAINYWDDYEISLSDLSIDGIKQIGSYSFKNREGLYTQIIPDDICFALPILDRTKIYRPLVEDRSRKWMSDFKAELFWHLRYGNDVAPVGFVGSSYKDIRVVFNAATNELDCYAPGVSETALATQIAAWPIMSRLREHSLVLIGMDFDRAGREAAINWSKALAFHKINHIILEQEELKVGDRVLKDYADVKKYTGPLFRDVVRIINQIINNKV